MTEPAETAGRPLVSVVMVSRQPGPGADTALRSVLAQTWTDLEILLVQEGGDVAVHDRRIRLVPMPPTGDARNAALDVATGEFVAFQDPDAWSHPRRLERQLTPLLADGALVATTSRAIEVARRPDGQPPGEHPPRTGSASPRWCSAANRCCSASGSSTRSTPRPAPSTWPGSGPRTATTGRARPRRRRVRAGPAPPGPVGLPPRVGAPGTHRLPRRVHGVARRDQGRAGGPVPGPGTGRPAVRRPAPAHRHPGTRVRRRPRRGVVGLRRATEVDVGGDRRADRPGAAGRDHAPGGVPVHVPGRPGRSARRSSSSSTRTRSTGCCRATRSTCRCW